MDFYINSPLKRIDGSVDVLVGEFLLLYSYGTGNKMEVVTMSIGERIKIYRKEKELTQSQLAELIGVSTQAVSKWETGVGMPDILQIVPLARILDISTDKLLGHTDEDFEREVAEIRKKSGGINLISDTNRATELYDLSSRFWAKHPDVPDIALVCLECFVELFAKNSVIRSNNSFIEEAERYAGILSQDNNRMNDIKAVEELGGFL